MWRLRRVIVGLSGLVLALAILSAQPALADWRKDIGVFRIGLVAEPGTPEAVSGLPELTRAFTMALGVKVEFMVAGSYAALIAAQTSSQLHYAIYSATSFAAASERCKCVEPLVAPVGEDRSIGIRSVLITRDNRLPSLKDMAQRKVAVLADDNVAGFQLPVATLAEDGLNLTGQEPFLVRANTASEAETMLVDGSVDAIFGWTPSPGSSLPDGEGGTLARLEAAGLDLSALTTMWKSEVLRYGPHAVLKSLDPEAKRILATFLTGLNLSAPDLYDLLERHHRGGFVTVRESDYAPAFAVVRRFGAQAAEE